MKPFNKSKVKTTYSPSTFPSFGRTPRQKSKVIIVMGPPGAGKGIQAILLSEKFDLFYLETSGIIEKKINEAKKNEFVLVEGKKYYFAKQKELWKRGKLFEPPFTTYLVQEKIKELFKEGKNLVLSGSPRSLYEGERVIPLLKKIYGTRNIKIILLEITPQETIKRNSQRRICQLMRHPILWTKETVNLKKCPLDGSKLVKRKGLDDPETIKVRLKEYRERTLPLLNYFKKKKLKVYKINGSPPPAVVFKNILKVLK
ncbi:MAG: nucleoside monophosphate kinase [Patescibacteria group bacterium]|nr:nucleoside monophosphate kinase [Patescibacteria group bacterium]